MNIRYSITSGKEGLGITTLETIYKGTCVWTSKLNENVFELKAFYPDPSKSKVQGIIDCFLKSLTSLNSL